MSKDKVNSSKNLRKEEESMEEKQEDTIFAVPKAEDLGDDNVVTHDLGDGRKIVFELDEDGEAIFSIVGENLEKAAKEELSEEVELYKQELENLELQVSKVQEKKEDIMIQKDEIKVTRVAKSIKDGPIVGWADLELGGIKLRDLKVVKSVNKPGTHFVSSPQIKSKKDGKFYSIFGIKDKELRNEVNKIVITAVLDASGPAPVPAQSSANAPAQQTLINDDLDLAMIAKDVEEKLYSSATTVQGSEIKSYAKGNCRGVDIGKYRFMTQNPTKNSDTAKLAREGHKIVWIFKGGTYLAKIQDGKFEMLGQTQPDSK